MGEHPEESWCSLIEFRHQVPHVSGVRIAARVVEIVQPVDAHATQVELASEHVLESVVVVVIEPKLMHMCVVL